MSQPDPQVLHVVSNLSPVEGSVVAACRLAIAQHNHGSPAMVLAAYAADTDNSLSRELADHGVELVRVPLTTRRQHARGTHAQAIRAAVQRVQAVHIHGLYETLYRDVLDEAHRAGRLKIVSPHGMLTPWSLRQRWLKKWLYRKVFLNRCLRHVEVLHFTTTAERDQSTRDGTPRAAPAVIPLPMDFAPIDAACTEKMKDGNEATPRIAFVGRIVEGKGVDVLIDAMAHVAHPTAELMLIGDDQTPYAQWCKDRAATQGVAERVRFTGRIVPPTLFTELRWATLFALPSEHENFGQSAVEAMACGTPCLLSHGVAVGTEAVAEGAAAWVSRYPQTLGGEIDRWLSDGAGRGELARKGMRWSRQTFGMEAIARQWQELLGPHLSKH